MENQAKFVKFLEAFLKFLLQNGIQEHAAVDFQCTNGNAQLLFQIRRRHIVQKDVLLVPQHNDGQQQAVAQQIALQLIPQIAAGDQTGNVHRFTEELVADPHDLTLQTGAFFPDQAHHPLHKGRSSHAAGNGKGRRSLPSLILHQQCAPQFLFKEALRGALLMEDEGLPAPAPFTIACGMAAAPFMERMVGLIREKCPGLDYKVIGIRNKFFGETVDVSGLVTGGDLLEQLKGNLCGSRLLLPIVMLRDKQNVFLDDVTPQDLERELGCNVRALDIDGGVFLDAVLEIN